MGAPPFTFREDRNTVFYHDVRIYIFGADVTPYLTGQLSITKADRDGINSCNFSLSNAMRCFEITADNLSGKFRSQDPYAPDGHYSELPKKTIYDLKKNDPTNLKHAVKSFGPITSTTSLIGSRILVAPGASRNSSGQSATTTERYPFTIGSLVFHKYDPIRVFVKNPFSTSNDEWTCEFAGYVDVKPYSQDYTTGQSIINITAQDIRVLMQAMRTQTNPVAQQGNENTLTLTARGNAVKDTIDAGFFQDLIPKNATISHVLGSMTFRQSINFLVFGIDARITQKTPGATLNSGANATTGASSTNLGQIGKLKQTTQVVYNIKDRTAAKKTLETWNNIIQFGEKQTYLTYNEMHSMGQETRNGGKYAPDTQYVRFLAPDTGAPVNNLQGYFMDGNTTARIDWSSRFELLTNLCKSVDYQFYVSGMGDLIFEFPMYDFSPFDYNETYNALYSFDKHVMSDDINDEGGNVISGLVVNSSYTFSEYNNQATLGQTPVATNLQQTNTIFSNVLASRIGPHIETHTVPGVTDQNRLMQLGMIEFNKRIANFDKFGLEATYRPYINVNRPIYHAIKERIGLIKTITYSWKIREDVTMSMDLFSVRKREADGRFRFITGGEAVPISYNTIYDKTYVAGQGTAGAIPQSGEPKSKATNKAPSQ